MSSQEHLPLPLKSEFARLAQIASSLDFPEPEKIWRPASARAFAEELILARDDAKASALMQEDPGSATAFLELLGEVLRQVKRGTTTPRPEPEGDKLPFYLLAALVLDYCDAILEVDPDSYQDA